MEKCDDPVYPLDYTFTMMNNVLNTISKLENNLKFNFLLTPNTALEGELLVQ